MRNILITKEAVTKALKRGIAKLVIDPNIESGTVCQIGDYWFYFGGLEAEEASPEEYQANVPIEDIVNEIYDVLCDFATSRFTINEYIYYRAVLTEQGCM